MTAAAITAPTGVLLGTYVPDTAEWEEARGGLCVTATEIAAVMGLSPWQSRFSLWHKKSGLPSPPFEQTPAMEWGCRLEPAVADKWSEEHADTTELLAGGTWQHKDRPWQRATPDFLFTPLVGWMIPPGQFPQLLEIKTSPTGEGWEDGVPVYYQCQIQWQLDTLGLQTCHVALLVAGHDYREFVVEYDPDDAYVLRSAAEEFLDDVRNGVRPPIDDSDATYQTIRRQHPGREDVDVEIPAELADRYQDTGATLAVAKDARRQAASELLDLLGDGYRAVTPEGRRVAYRTVRDGHTHALQPYTQKDTAA